MPAKGRRAHHDERAFMLVGTKRGLFVYESDFEREKWKRTGPYLADREVTSIAYDHRDRRSILAATAGGGLHRSRDLGRTWEKVGQGLPSERLAHLCIGHLGEPGVLWAGLQETRLARSGDGGGTFAEITGFTQLAASPDWKPPAGAATPVTSIVVHPDAHILHAAAGAAGVFRSPDTGETWVACNAGLGKGPAPPLVYRLGANPAKADRLYAATDSGFYRSDDAGTTWQPASDGLHGKVSRSMVVSPSRPGTVFVVPVQEKSAGIVVYRSHEGGSDWVELTEGLPERGGVTVNPEAMAMDTLDDEGLYFGTAEGTIFVSVDEGETWGQAASGVAPVLSIEVITEQE